MLTVAFEGGVLHGQTRPVECQPGRPYSYPYLDSGGNKCIDTYLPVVDPSEAFVLQDGNRIPRYRYSRTTQA